MLQDSNVHDEAPRGGPAQDFVIAISGTGLSQLVKAPTHLTGHMLDLIFTDGCRLMVVSKPCKVGVPSGMVCLEG